MLLLTDNTYIYSLDRIEGALYWIYCGRRRYDPRAENDFLVAEIADKDLVVAKISDDELMKRGVFLRDLHSHAYPYQDGDY